MAHLTPQYLESFQSAFKAAFEATFKIQFNCPIEVQGAKATSFKGEPSAVASSLTFQSTQMKGTFAVLLPEITFLNLLETMIGEKHAAVSAENIDAASELANIIYASARKQINALGSDFKPALPLVSYGKDVQIHHSVGSDILIFSCQSEIGAFHAELSLKAA